MQIYTYIVADEANKLFAIRQYQYKDQIEGVRFSNPALKIYEIAESGAEPEKNLLEDKGLRFDGSGSFIL